MLFSKISRKKLDMSISTAPYRTDLGTIIDYTNFVYNNEAFFNVCFPRRISGVFNILRPFG